MLPGSVVVVAGLVVVVLEVVPGTVVDVVGVVVVGSVVEVLDVEPGTVVVDDVLPGIVVVVVLDVSGIDEVVVDVVASVVVVLVVSTVVVVVVVGTRTLQPSTWLMSSCWPFWLNSPDPHVAPTVADWARCGLSPALE